MPFTKTRSKRRNELKELLDIKVVRKRRDFEYVKKYIHKNYKTILITIFVIFSILTYIIYYNMFAVMKQNVTNAEAQVQSALQMRQNIIPALTIVVYQFINHENNIFLKTVEARESISNNSNKFKKLRSRLDELIDSGATKSALSNFIAVAENYPQLVSSASDQLLIGQIAETEKQIYEKRLLFNDEVNIYNTILSTFPANAAGRVLGFRPIPYFEWKNKSEWEFKSLEDQGELPVTMKLRDS